MTCILVGHCSAEDPGIQIEKQVYSCHGNSAFRGKLPLICP